MKSLLAAALLAAPCLACIALPHGGDSVSVKVPEIHLDEQKAFLYREGGNEHMILSVKYSGGTDQFAWVIPVESKPKVDVQAGAPFHELEELTRIRRPQLQTAGAAKASAPGAPPPVEVIERKEVGPYDVAVLKAATGGGLFEWLHKNGFPLTQNARAALDFYVHRNYTFVATRIRPARSADTATAQRLQQGTIAPIHLTYAAKQLSYPLRVTAGNPGPSSISIYTADPHFSERDVNVSTGRTDAFSPPGSSREATFHGLTVTSFGLKPRGQKGFNVFGPPEASHDQGDFPTLRKLLPQGGTLKHYEGVLIDDQRQQDLVF